jgi:hypothetical protein
MGEVYGETDATGERDKHAGGKSSYRAACQFLYGINDASVPVRDEYLERFKKDGAAENEKANHDDAAGIGQANKKPSKPYMHMRRTVRQRRLALVQSSSILAGNQRGKVSHIAQLPSQLLPLQFVTPLVTWYQIADLNFRS